MFSPFLPVFNKGETKFQPVYVDDLAKAVDLIIDQDITSEIYAIAGDTVYSFRELLEFMLDVIGKKRLIIDMPVFAGQLLACVSKILPAPIIKRDQLRLLKTESIVLKGMKTLHDLGITPTTMQDIVPRYLKRFVV